MIDFSIQIFKKQAKRHIELLIYDYSKESQLGLKLRSQQRLHRLLSPTMN